MDDSELKHSFNQKLSAAIALKDYAISNNLGISDDIIKNINEVATKSTIALGVDMTEVTRLDQALRDLTAITYPTSPETIIQAGRHRGKRTSGSVFLWSLVSLGLLILVLAIFAFDRQVADANSRLWPSIVAISLGVLGVLTYIYFNLIGIIAEKAFSLDDIEVNIIRLILGGVVGWVFFFAFGGAGSSQLKRDPSAILLLPFLAGFSTRLVIGLINQAIRAVELVLGLEDKSTELLRRKRSSGRGRANA